MALRDTASKSDYTFGTICGLYLEELVPGFARASV